LNKLQQVALGASDLRGHVKAETYGMSTSCMLAFYRPYLSLFTLASGMGTNDTNSTNEMLVDQRERAYEVARGLQVSHNNLTQLMHDSVRMMVGFGTTFFLVLEAILEMHGEQVVNDFVFQLVDNVPSVTAWHQIIFQVVKVQCLTDDIVKSDILLRPQTFLYLNFCGLSESMEVMTRFFNIMAEEASKPTSEYRQWSCLLSFSVARKAKSEKVQEKFEKSNRKGKSGWTHKLISTRPDFPTYVVRMGLSSHENCLSQSGLDSDT
jgi:hypothetical protein